MIPTYLHESADLPILIIHNMLIAGRLKQMFVYGRSVGGKYLGQVEVVEIGGDHSGRSWWR